MSDNVLILMNLEMNHCQTMNFTINLSTSVCSLPQTDIL
jgi:hypothetical protein